LAIAKERVVGVSRTDQDTTNPYSDGAVEQAILLALKGIRFGSVEIIVHDSRVVQIERKEKTRFDGTLSRPVR
jgi:hypothetical protein